MFKKLMAKWKNLPVKRKILGILTLVLILILAGGALAYSFWFDKPRQSVSIDSNGNVVVTQADDRLKLDHRVNLLLIGVDERKNTKDKTYRTDTLILTSIDPQTQRITMLSIPRDTKVQIPKKGMDKINAAAAYGGLNMTVAVVQNLTGVKIDGYVKTNFDGFKQIIDTLGGVTINVEKDMYYETGDATDGIIDLKKGEQLLDGAKALQYARFRHDAYADITRTGRQQIVLKAVAQKLMQPSSIPKIPQLVPQFISAVETNLPPSDLLTVAKVAVKYDSSKVISQTVPGYFLDDDGISYWGVDPDYVKKIVADLFNNATVLGNTPDKLITASLEASTNGGKPIAPDPEPQVTLGRITAKALSPTSISVDVTASRGIASADVWRVSGAGQVRVGSKWPGTSAWHVTDSSLIPGATYHYVLKVYDAKGNLISAKNSNEVTTPDLEPATLPTLTLNEPSNETVSTSVIAVSGSASAGCAVYISLNGNQEKIASNGGSFSKSVTLVPGSNVIVVKAVNAAGQASVTRKVTYLGLTITSPTTTTSDTISVTGTTAPGCTVSVNGQAQTVSDATGNFTCTGVHLQDGPNTLTVVAMNNEGKSVTKILTVTKTKTN